MAKKKGTKPDEKIETPVTEEATEVVEETVETPKEEAPIESPVEEPKVEEKKKGNKKVLLIILAILILIGLGVGLFFLGKNAGEKKENDTKSSEKKENTNKDDEEEEEDDGEIVDQEEIEGAKLVVYKNEYRLCIEKEEWCKEEAYVIEADSQDAKLYDVYEQELVLYGDNGKLISWNVKKDKKQTISLEADYDDYAYELLDGKLVGISFYNYEGKYQKVTKSGFYNIAKDKKIYTDKKYTSFEILDEKYMQAFSYTGQGDPESYDDENDYVSYLVGVNTEKTYLSDKGVCSGYSIWPSGKAKFVYHFTECVGVSTSAIYTYDELIQLAEEDATYDVYDGLVSVVDGNVVKTYDSKGKLLETSKEIENIALVARNTIVYKKDDKAYIYDGKEDTELCEWKKAYQFHWPLSGYYDKDDLENENEKEAGVYLIFEYDGDGEQGPGFEIYYNLKTREVKRYELEEIGGYAKPILYLYPEKETKVTVDFEHEDKLTTTYPKFKDSWVVTAKPNGDLYDKNGKYYYGLYWEEDLNHHVDFSKGFYVTKENAIEFLEEKLTIIGLNERERNEFIMYWLPILEKNGKNLVYFELTEERDAYNKLMISPKPDSILRVAIHVKKVNRETKIREQKLTSFERKGFTAVEWGGVQYK